MPLFWLAYKFKFDFERQLTAQVNSAGLSPIWLKATPCSISSLVWHIRGSSELIEKFTPSSTNLENAKFAEWITAFKYWSIFFSTLKECFRGHIDKQQNYQYGQQYGWLEKLDDTWKTLLTKNVISSPVTQSPFPYYILQFHIPSKWMCFETWLHSTG